jgi:hypothetical protein
MFLTQTTKSILLVELIDHLCYRDNVSVQQTSIKLKNSKYRNLIFNTTAARNTFVHFMREEGFEVKVVDRMLPLPPLNYKPKVNHSCYIRSSVCYNPLSI